MVDRQGAGELTGEGRAGGLTAGPEPTSNDARPRLRIATRQSRLALWQAGWVQSRLREHYPQADLDLVGLTTQGDRILDRPLADIGGKGLFIKELETALLDGRAELAVHSLKDVPMEMPEGFLLGAILEREDPRDAFVSNDHADLDALPQGAVVGTSSLRRALQVSERRPDLQIRSLRGNIDTRLAKLDAGDYAAIILAAAGLKRLGLAQRIRGVLPPAVLLPAPGQGAVAIELRDDQPQTLAAVAVLEHRPTVLAVTAERSLARRLGGSCRSPLAAYASFEPDGRLRLDALIADAAGRARRTGASAPVGTAEEAAALGERVADELAPWLPPA